MAPASDDNRGAFRERLARIETRLQRIEMDVAGIYGIMKWIALGISGAILTAAANFILNGGLIAHVGPATGGG